MYSNSSFWVKKQKFNFYICHTIFYIVKKRQKKGEPPVTYMVPFQFKVVIIFGVLYFGCQMVSECLTDILFMLHCSSLKRSTVTCFSWGVGVGTCTYSPKCWLIPESLMHHNLETCFGTFVEICRKSHIQASKQKSQNTARKSIPPPTPTPHPAPVPGWACVGCWMCSH